MRERRRRERGVESGGKGQATARGMSNRPTRTLARVIMQDRNCFYLERIKRMY